MSDFFSGTIGKIDLKNLSIDELHQILHGAHELTHQCYREQVKRTSHQFGLAFFCTARTSAPEYTQVAVETEQFITALASDGTVDRVISGVGPSLMEVANRAASNAGIRSLRVPIPIPDEKVDIDFDHQALDCDGLDMRVSTMECHSDVVILGPLAGVGTLYEGLRVGSRGQLHRKFGELIHVPYLYRSEQTGLITPVIAVGELWQGMFDTLEDMCSQGLIDKRDLELIRLVPDYEAAAAAVREIRAEWDQAKLDKAA